MRERCQAIESQRITVPVQKQPVLNVEKIRDTLNCLIDFTQPKLDEMLLDKVVDRVIPITNDHFRWELNLLSGEHNAVECSIKGRKNKVSVSIEETVRSDTLSNIFSEKIAPTGGPLDRQQLKIHVLESRRFLQLNVDYDKARSYRNSRGCVLWPKQWKDLTVKVVL